MGLYKSLLHCSAIQDINHPKLLFIQVYATLESGMASAMFAVFLALIPIASGVEVDCITLGDALQTVSSDVNSVSKQGGG